MNIFSFRDRLIADYAEYGEGIVSAAGRQLSREQLATAKKKLEADKQ